MAKLKEDEIGPRTHLVPRDRDKTCNEGRAVATPAESSHFQIIGDDSGEKRYCFSSGKSLVSALAYSLLRNTINENRLLQYAFTMI